MAVGVYKLSLCVWPLILSTMLFSRCFPPQFVVRWAISKLCLEECFVLSPTGAGWQQDADLASTLSEIKNEDNEEMKWWWFSFWTMSVCWSVARCDTLIPSPQHHKHSVFRRVRTTRRTNYFYSGVTWLLACQWCEHVSMLMVAAPCLHPHCLLQAVCWIALTDKIVLKNCGWKLDCVWSGGIIFP